MAASQNNWVPCEEDKSPKMTRHRKDTDDDANLTSIPVEEEEMQHCSEKDVCVALKRLLQEKATNNQIEEWIQVIRDETTVELDMPAETMSVGINH